VLCSVLKTCFRDENKRQRKKSQDRVAHQNNLPDEVMPMAPLVSVQTNLAQRAKLRRN